MKLTQPPKARQANPAAALGEIVFGAMLAVVGCQAGAMQLKLTFDEILAGADGVFIGTVITQSCRVAPTGRMIFTDAEMAVAEWVGGRGVATGTSKLALSFAGGRVGDLVCVVSDVPALKTGQTYLIFAKLDGRQYASPVPGACQGLFKVCKDSASGQQYATTCTDEAVVGVGERDLLLGPRIEGMSTGVNGLKLSRSPDPKFHDVAPVAVSGNPAHQARVSSVGKPAAAPPAPLPLDQFVREIKQRLAKVQSTDSAR